MPFVEFHVVLLDFFQEYDEGDLSLLATRIFNNPKNVNAI
jgi:hypothetical protein